MGTLGEVPDANMETQEDFVRYLRVQCTQTEESVMTNLKRPPGRDPWPGEVRRSRWFLALSSTDQRMVQEVVGRAVLALAFNLLVELDGRGSLEGTPEGGMLELRYRKGSQEIVLAGEGAEPDAHDVFWEYLEQGFAS